MTQKTIGRINQVNLPLHMKLLDQYLMKDPLLELVLDTQGDLRRFVRLFVNGDAIAASALDMPVGDGDKVGVLAAAAGG